MHCHSMAGADPVATAIRAALLYVSSNSHISTSLQAEFSKHGLLSSQSHHTILPYRSLRTLPYLTAVIREALRLFPPYVGLTEKVVPKGGATTPDGRHIPAGTTIGVSIMALLRDPKVFGADVDVFRPERWILADETARAGMERSTELVFSAGRYGCLGKEVGLMQVFKIVGECLRRWSVSSADCMSMGPGMGEEGKAMGIWVQKGVWATFRALEESAESL